MSQSQLENTEDSEKSTNKLIESPISEDIDRERLLEKYIQHIDSRLSDIFPNSEEAKIADAIMTVFKKREKIDVFNKKALFVYIKEITDTNSNSITKVIKVLKKRYMEMLNDRLENHDQ